MREEVSNLVCSLEPPSKGPQLKRPALPVQTPLIVLESGGFSRPVPRGGISELDPDDWRPRADWPVLVPCFFSAIGDI
jgi:hypothetical protein